MSRWETTATHQVAVAPTDVWEQPVPMPPRRAVLETAAADR